jgi:uncharacterized protein with HEPN domain
LRHHPLETNCGYAQFLAHQYLGVDIALVWNILEHDLPQLQICIAMIAKAEKIHLNPFGAQADT